MIASDVHGSSYYAKRIKQVFEQEGAQLLVLLGDIYNPGKERMMVIKGNCDSQVDTLISEFSFVEEGALFVGGKRITLTHGHVFDIDRLPPSCGDALIYGHVHTGFIAHKDGVTVANPGSVTLPKEGTAHSYLVLNEDELILKDIDNGKIIEQDKIR